MWIAMNDSFVSLVRDTKDHDRLVVRSRTREDIEAFITKLQCDAEIIETEDSDYRFRIFVYKIDVAEAMCDMVCDIDYPNFKDSVKDHWRKQAYTQIWYVMYMVQANLYGYVDFYRKGNKKT